MTEHKYLDDRKKAISAAAWIGATAAVLLVAGALMAKGGHTLLPNLLLTLGAAAMTALTCFVIHCIRHNAYDGAGVKRAVGVLHLYAAHAITTAAALYAGGFGSFSYTVLHAVCDGLLAALLTLGVFTLLDKSGGLLSAIVGVAAAVLSLLELTLAVNLLLAVLGAALFIVSLLRRKNGLGALCLITGLLSAVFAVLSLNVGGADIPHMCLHFAALVGGLALICAVLAANPAVVKVPAAKTRAQDAGGRCGGNEDFRIGHSGETATPQTVGNPLNGEKWIVKRFQGLSASELLLAPVSALYGVSEGDAEHLKNAFNIKTIGDLADNKYFRWAEEIDEEAHKE